MPPPRRVRSNQSKERKKAKPTTASLEIVSMSRKHPGVRGGRLSLKFEGKQNNFVLLFFSYRSYVPLCIWIQLFIGETQSTLPNSSVVVRVNSGVWRNILKMPFWCFEAHGGQEPWVLDLAVLWANWNVCGSSQMCVVYRKSFGAR